MKKNNFSGVVKAIQMTMSKHSAEILMGIGIAGMISAAVMTGTASVKASKLIEEERNKREEIAAETEEVAVPLNNTDIVKLTWKCYIPAVTVGASSLICLFGANSVNARRNAALATAYAISESAFSEYKEKVVETLGEKKEKVIRDEIAKDHLERNPIRNNEVIITGKGEHLCYDVISGRYFKSDYEKIRRIENELNRKLRNEMYISLNEFYYEIGLPCVKLGHDLGWNVDDGEICFNFSSHLSEDNTPCMVVDYNFAPRYDFRNLM